MRGRIVARRARGARNSMMAAGGDLVSGVSKYEVVKVYLPLVEIDTRTERRLEDREKKRFQAAETR